MRNIHIAPSRRLKKGVAHLEKAEVVLPLIGYISLDIPWNYLPTAFKRSNISHSFCRSNLCLTVQGDSFRDEAIQNGDFLLIEARQDIQPGEIMLGLINQTDTLLRRYFPEGQSIRLESQNSQIRPLIIRSDNTLIQGALIGLLRLY